MKVWGSILAVITFCVVFLMSSCTKTYICHCDVTYNSSPGVPDTTYKEFNITDTKGNAQSICNKQTNTYNQNNIYTIENCYLY